MSLPPRGGKKGYLFAAFRTKIKPEKAIEFLKKEGDFLHLNQECRVSSDCKRITQLLTLNNEVVMKINYSLFYAFSSDIEIVKTDAEIMLEQVENLLYYAEASVSQKGGK